MQTEYQRSKQALRVDMLAKRNIMSSEQVLAAGAAIAERVLASAVYLSAHTVCSYLAIGNEVPTAPILLAAFAAGKRVILPRTHFAPNRLSLHEIFDLTSLHTRRYGILEPSPDAPLVRPEDIDLFLIPGSAFDLDGNRLGYGAGFYDMVLARNHGCRMALAYDWQVLPQIPNSAHDVPMDLLVTEYDTHLCRTSIAERLGQH